MHPTHELYDRALIEEVLRGVAELVKAPGRPPPPFPESEHEVRVVHGRMIVRAAPVFDPERNVTAWQVDIAGDES